MKALPSLGVPDSPHRSLPQPVSTPLQEAINLDFKSIVTMTVTSPKLPHNHPFKKECKVDFLRHVKLFLGIFGDKVPIRKLINYTFVSTPKLMTAHSKAPCSCHRTLLPVSGWVAANPGLCMGHLFPGETNGSLRWDGGGREKASPWGAFDVDGFWMRISTSVLACFWNF